MEAARLRREHESLCAQLAFTTAQASTTSHALATLSTAHATLASHTASHLRTHVGSTLPQLRRLVHGLLRSLSEAEGRAEEGAARAAEADRVRREERVEGAQENARLGRSLVEETRKRIAAQAALSALREEAWEGNAEATALLAELGRLRDDLERARERAEGETERALDAERKLKAALRREEQAKVQAEAAKAQADHWMMLLQNQHDVVATVEDELGLAQAQIAPLEAAVAERDAIIAKLEIQINDAHLAIRAKARQTGALEQQLNASFSSIKSLKSETFEIVDTLHRSSVAPLSSALTTLQNRIHPALQDLIASFDEQANAAASSTTPGGGGGQHLSAGEEAHARVVELEAQVRDMKHTQKRLSDALSMAAKRSASHDARMARLRAQLEFARDEARAARVGSDEDPPVGRVTLMFTDVQSSTKQWAANPNVMAAALKTHNSLIRDILVPFGGYEVKTEGDAFMVAFSSPQCAVAAAVKIQSELMSAQWPVGLLNNPASAELRGDDGSLLFRGLRVRVGIHTGEPIAARDPVTNRMDYFGPMVNLSARVESSARGGQILISAATVDALDPEFVDSLVVEDLGEFHLKGIPIPTNLYSVYSIGLKERKSVLAADAAADSAAAAAAATPAVTDAHAPGLGIELNTSLAAITEFLARSQPSTPLIVDGQGGGDAGDRGNQRDASPMFSTMAMELQRASEEQTELDSLIVQLAKDLEGMSVDTESLRETIERVTTFTSAVASPVVSFPKDLQLDALEPEQLAALARQQAWIQEKSEELKEHVLDLEDVLEEMNAKAASQADYETVLAERDEARAKANESRKVIRQLRATIAAQLEAAAEGGASTRRRRGKRNGARTNAEPQPHAVERKGMYPSKSAATIASHARIANLTSRVSKAWLARVRASSSLGSPGIPANASSPSLASPSPLLSPDVRSLASSSSAIRASSTAGGGLWRP